MTVAREITIPVGRTVGPVSGILDRPAKAWGLLAFAHGAGAGMRHAFMAGVAERLAARGLATLRYQFPYVERGNKRPDPPGVLTATVRAAVARAAEEDLPLFAGGKSLGGRMTSTAGSSAALPGVRGIVFFGFPLHAPGRASAERGEHLARVEVPMLFLQGTRDSLADLAFLTPVVESLGDRATLHVVEGGDHSFHVPKRSGRSDEEVLDELAEATASWARSALP
jgi:hypothetical protein